jgi:KRAB domain-containing zinc finger protein
MEGELLEPLDGELLDVSFVTEVATTPSKAKVFECAECGKTLKKKSNLARHLRCHARAGPCIRCSGCNQYFESEDEKKEHDSEKHAGILCEVCGKTFRRRSDLNVHSILHSQEPQKSFQCPFEQCGRFFVRERKYQDHVNIHTGAMPYTCMKCAKKFRCRYRKRDHEVSCMGLKDLKCEVCSREFTQRAGLYNHKRAEHSDRLYVCRCGATYKYPTSLARHQRKQHH